MAQGVVRTEVSVDKTQAGTEPHCLEPVRGGSCVASLVSCADVYCLAGARHRAAYLRQLGFDKVLSHLIRMCWTYIYLTGLSLYRGNYLEGGVLLGTVEFRIQCTCAYNGWNQLRYLIQHRIGTVLGPWTALRSEMVVKFVLDGHDHQS